ncbi:MAG: pyruvate formate-lyase-activating protein [Rikenellaceae bacterium]
MLKIHSYESMGTLDGPGLRFVVFLQGCNFRCLYCANPDTIECRGGEEVSIDEIFEKVCDMQSFFGRRGGVTFSGGEPLLQARELIELFRRFKAAGINTCIDTNGSIWNSDVEQLLQLTDLVLLDVKQIDDVKHRALTSKSNSQTLATAKWLEQNNKPFWLRYVLVPTISDEREDLENLGKTLGSYQMIQRVEILPYHRLGVHKYEELKMEYKLSHIGENSLESLVKAEKIAQKYFKSVYVG